MIKENLISYSIFDIEADTSISTVCVNDVFFQFPDQIQLTDFLSTGIYKLLRRQFRSSKAEICIAKFATHQHVWSNKLKYGSDFPPDLMITPFILKTRMKFENEYLNKLSEPIEIES